MLIFHTLSTFLLLSFLPNFHLNYTHPSCHQLCTQLWNTTSLPLFSKYSSSCWECFPFQLEGWGLAAPLPTSSCFAAGWLHSAESKCKCNEYHLSYRGKRVQWLVSPLVSVRQRHFLKLHRLRHGAERTGGLAIYRGKSVVLVTSCV